MFLYFLYKEIMIIISLKGKNGSGKSTVAAMLAKKLDEKGISNKILSFAEPLKKIVDKLYTFTGIAWEDRGEKEINRDKLEETANVIKESLNFNPFVTQLLNQLDLLYDTAKVVIVSDLRFESEYNGLYNWLETDDLYVLEILNKLTDNNPDEYQLKDIPSDDVIVFDSEIENQLDHYLDSIL
jgi:thymidylate kinase